MTIGRHTTRAWAAAIGLLAAGTCWAWAGQDRIKLGVLTDMSGPYAALTGRGSAIAAQMAIEDFGGRVLGRSIELVVADHGSKPDVGATLARSWYDAEGVDAIFDGAGSSVALAILEIARSRSKIVAFSGVVSPDITGKLCAPTASSWAWDTYAMVATSVRSLMRSGARRVFFVTLDAAAGRQLEAEASEIVRAEGGTIVGSVKHPLNNSDFSSFLLQAQAAGPDVIVLANAGKDTVNSMKQAGEFGLTAGPKPIAVVGLLALINDVEALGPDRAQGMMVSESFYWNLDEHTRAWNARFAARSGTAANMLQAAVYSSVFHYLKGVQRAGTNEGLAVAGAMRALPVEDFYSDKLLLRADGRVERDFHLFRVKAPTKSQDAWDLYEPIALVSGREAFPVGRSACPSLRSSQ